jgi:hypothetical protein
VWSGPGAATQVFQTAGQKISETPITLDGMFGPQSILVINAVAAKDPELLVETANCLALDRLKHSPGWERFSPIWSQRLRAFSPVILRGVCPELAAADTNAASSAAR